MQAASRSLPVRRPSALQPELARGAPPARVPEPVVGVVDPWDVTPPPRPTDSLQTRMERLPYPAYLHFRLRHLLVASLGPTALFALFVAQNGRERAFSDPRVFALFTGLLIGIVILHAALLMAMDRLPPRPFIAQVRRAVQAHREARWIRQARLPGPAQLERVLQLAMPRTLYASGLFEWGDRLITLSERHPRIPRALWKDAWVRTLVRSMADWDVFALVHMMGQLKVFIERHGSPLAPHDGVDILVQAIRSARFPPGPPDGQRAAAVLRWTYVSDYMNRLARIRPWDGTLQQHAATQLSAMVNETAFQPWPFWGNEQRPELQQRGMGRRATRITRPPG